MQGSEPAAPASVTRLLLRIIPLFADLSDSELDTLSAVAVRRRIKRGTTVIAAGEPGDSLNVVISGRLKVVLQDKTGHEVILHMLGPNEYFGEMAPIDDAPRSATVIATEPCEVLVLSREPFMQCLNGHFDMTLKVMGCLVRRLRSANRKIGNLAMLDVFGRVAAQLLEMSELRDGQRVVPHRLARQEVASMVGASREMVSRVWKALQAGGYISIRGNVIYLDDKIGTLH